MKRSEVLRKPNEAKLRHPHGACMTGRHARARAIAWPRATAPCSCEARLRAWLDNDLDDLTPPACDLIVAWNLFNAESREVLRAALNVDEATRKRGRGWALSAGLIALPYYEHSKLQQCHDMPCANALLTLSSMHDARYE